jgi:tetratricopeptide (TPR) repeat protein
MKRLLACWSLLFVQHLLLAQKDVVSAATELIVAGKYAAANHYLDSLLRKQPRNADALMMKGNVVLNHALDTAQPASFVTAEDESVFTSEISAKPKPVTKSTVAAIEKFWRRSLKIDPTRADIRKGLCSVYAMALMKEPLKREIVALMKIEKDDGEQAFRMAAYARKFKEWNRFDEAMEVYRFIANLYPSLAGIRCDIASEYFYEGRINESLEWLDSCYNFKTVDETSFLNGAFIYSQLGYYDDAQNVLNTYSRLYERKMDQFYYGLRLFADTMDKYYVVLDTFCQTVDSNAYSTEVALARRLLAYRATFSFEDYKRLVQDDELPDYYKVLIYARALRQFTDHCEPLISYGIYQASIKNYSSAIQFLEEVGNCEINQGKKDFATLVYAYTMFQSDTLKSLGYFQQLYASANKFYQQAAKYFSFPGLIKTKPQ